MQNTRGLHVLICMLSGAVEYQDVVHFVPLGVPELAQRLKHLLNLFFTLLQV